MEKKFSFSITNLQEREKKKKKIEERKYPIINYVGVVVIVPNLFTREGKKGFMEKKKCFSIIISSNSFSGIINYDWWTVKLGQQKK